MSYFYRIDDKKERINDYAFVMGILCLLVVYMHSNYVGGFDISSPFSDSHTIRRILNVILFTVVPIFFILWGYLSAKYINAPESASDFLKQKFIQFYPIYAFFFLVNYVYKWDTLKFVPFWKIILGAGGVFWEPGFTGGNIYVVVFFCVLTMCIMKKICANPFMILLFILCLMLVLKLSQREQMFYLFRYLGYYTAYWFGIFIKYHNLLEDKHNKQELVLICLLIGIAFGSLLSEFFGLGLLEIGYCPNSPEQLCLSFTFLYLGLMLTRIFFEYIPGFWKYIVCRIGSRAYIHFIIHLYVIKMQMDLGELFHINNKIVLQLFIILSTSLISVNIIYPLWTILERLALVTVERVYRTSKQLFFNNKN